MGTPGNMTAKRPKARPAQAWLSSSAGTQPFPQDGSLAYRASTGGRIALAIQYGHLRTIATSEGYSGRARHGLARVLDIETAAAMSGYLQHVSERLDAGETVSGPAAPRLMNAARDAATRYEGMFLSPRQARVLLADPAMQVHDNPRAFLACNYDPAKALCHPSRESRRPPGPGPVQPGLRQHRPHR